MRIASVLAAFAARFGGLRRFADSSGATVLEYAIVLTIVSVAAIAALTVLGNHASTTLSTAGNSIAS